MIGLLQSPLCALACLETSMPGGADAPLAIEIAARPSEPTPAARTPDAGAMAGSPCHGMAQAVAEDSAPGNPKNAPEPETDCVCEDTQAALVDGTDLTSLVAQDVTRELVAPAQRLLDLPPATPTAARLRLREADLPPPDLLLRKSSLIL